MIDEPTLVPSNALRHVRVALSVSESEDLNRLGLAESHLELVVAEVARAVILAGGTILYGGRLRPSGYTQVIMEEVRRYSDDRQALEIYVPQPEYRSMPREVLVRIDARLGMSGALRLVSGAGEARSIQEINCQSEDEEVSDAIALTAMRKLVSGTADARIVLGGKLVGYAGAEPGVIEEARMTIEASRRLYIVGGYGGGGAAIARTLGLDSFSWAPPSFPEGADSQPVESALLRVKTAYDVAAIGDGLDSDERRLLAVSHRPANIATLLVLGLSRAVCSGTC